MSVLNPWASLLSAEEKCFVHLKTWSSCLCKMLQFWSLTCVSTDTFFHIASSWGYVVFWSNLNLMAFLLFLPIILLCNFLVFFGSLFLFCFVFLWVFYLFLCFLLQDSAVGFTFVYPFLWSAFLPNVVPFVVWKIKYCFASYFISIVIKMFPKPANLCL